MAQTVGSLLIDLRADVASLRADMAKANAIIAQQSAQMNSALGKLSSGFAAVGRGAAALVAVVGAGRLLEFGKQALDAAGGLGELAEQLGIGTDALQVWQFAAVQSGLSTEQLEAGISKLSRTIGEASGGNKEAIDSFKNLGIRILDAGGNLRSTEDILGDIADAIAGIDDPAKRASAAVDFFGRSGQRLLPILSQGRAGLRDFEEQARRAGAILTPEQAKAADDAGDAIARLTFQWSKFAQTLAASVAPALSSVLAGLNSLTEGARRLGSAGTLQQQVESAQRDLAQFQGLLQRQGGRGMQPNAQQQAQLAALQGRLNAALEAQAEAERIGAGSRAPGPPPAGARNPTPTRTGGEPRDALGDALAKLRIQQENEFADSLQRQRDLLNPMATLQRAYNDEMRALTEALNSTNPQLHITNEEFNTLAAAAVTRLTENIAKLTPETEKASETMEAFGQIVSSAFEDAILRGERLSDVLKSLAQDMARVILRQAVLNPLGEGVKGLTSSLVSSIASSLFPVGPNTVAGGVSVADLTRLGPALPGRAEGGRVNPGEPYIVGERRPELFVPDVAGTIVPDLMGASGGVTNVFQINAQHSRLSASEMRAIINAAVGESRLMVVDDARRGGSRSTQLRGR